MNSKDHRRGKIRDEDSPTWRTRESRRVEGGTVGHKKISGKLGGSERTAGG